MNFLSPMTIAAAAGLTIPPLVGLYFLKLKRQVQHVPSTLLWKRTIEDLRVNAPFQRLRSNLLLLLQLIILILGAVALGKPMFQTADTHGDTIILMIDQSASMGVIEADGKTRLDIAKEKAKNTIDNMADGARAMVIAFCDRAWVESSFDRDREALKRRIDEIEQTQSTSSITEAVTLAEAHAQNIIIGGEEAGRDIAPESAAPPADLFLFTDGRISDAAKANVQKLELSRVRVHRIGERSDNVGITAVQARRQYERPEILEVTATVQNFGDAPVTVDATLYVDRRPADVQTVTLAAGHSAEAPGRGASRSVGAQPVPSVERTRTITFDETEFSGSGVVEVVLRVDDALAADDRAWVVVEPPQRIRVLLVTNGNMFLEAALSVLPIEVTKMAPALYESADDKILTDGERSAFDVVMFDRHSTSRLPHGSYMFWGAAPKIDGVEAGGLVNDEVIFNWDDTHPILRHVAVESISLFEWLRLTLPPEAAVLVEGPSSPVLAYLPRGPNQYLISAFSLIIEDDDGRERMNTTWSASADFVMFTQNAVHYLAANISTRGKQSVAPGEPVSLAVPRNVESMSVLRPEGETDRIPIGRHRMIHYARTRQVGVYRLEPAAYGQDAFAVNLLDPAESAVRPAESLVLGMEKVETRAGIVEVNEPAWRYFLIALLVFLLLEWIIYNKRVFV